MNNRKTRWFSFLIFMGGVFIFRGWAIFEHYHLSAFAILMAFIASLYIYIRTQEYVNKLSSANKTIVSFRLIGLISFFKKGNHLTVLERSAVFFSVYIPCMLIMYLNSLS